jgi:predicted Zn-dependent protease
VVLLNRAYLDQAAGWDDGQDRLDAVVLHEFGHLVGLDHVPDPHQLMYKQPTVHPGGFADGDRRGLALLSGGPCFRDF